MRALVLAASLAALALGTVASHAASTDFELAAQLDSRQAIPRPPYPVRAAGGTLAGSLDHQRRIVEWSLDYTKLSGPATTAGLRRGRRGAAGPLILVLCGPRAPVTRRTCKSGLKGTAAVSLATILALEAGIGYVDVRTKRNPTGEIRGQIVVKR